MTYQIAIPSYMRHDAIKKYTLKYLESTNVPKELITIFVSDTAGKKKYEEANPGYNVVVAEGTRSLVTKRQFISEYYPKGTRIVSFDDDVTRIERMVLDEPLETLTKPLKHPCHLEPVTDLDGFLNHGFNLAEERGVRLWGCYPVRNPGFLHPKITVGLRFVMGHGFGFYAGDPAFNEIDKYPCKDDFALSLYHYKNGKGTLRFDSYCIQSRAHSNSGGSCNDLVEKLAVNNDTCDRLCIDYEGLAAIKMRRTKDEWLAKYKEIRLKPITTETIDVRESCY